MGVMDREEVMRLMVGGGPRISGNLEVGGIYGLVGSGGWWGLWVFSVGPRGGGE